MVAQLDMIVYYDQTLEESSKPSNFNYLNFEMIRLAKGHVRMKDKYRMTLDTSGEVGFYISNVNVATSLM